MRRLLVFCLTLALAGWASADVVIYTSSNVPMTYEAGEQSGVLKPYGGKLATKTVIKNKQGEKTPFKILTADGKVVYSGEGAYSRTFFVSDTADGLKCQKVGWFTINGQAIAKLYRLVNITSEPLSFESKDRDGAKPKMTVQPGEFVDVPTNYSGTGANSLELQFDNGFTTTLRPSQGDVTVLYTVKYAPKVVQGQNLAPVNMPKGFTD